MYEWGIYMLEIREAEAKDALKVIEYLNLVGGESDNLLFGANGFHLTVEEEARMIEMWRHDENMAMLLGFINDELVANVLIRYENRSRIKHNGVLAVSVKKAYWHQ